MLVFIVAIRAENPINPRDFDLCGWKKIISRYSDEFKIFSLENWKSDCCVNIRNLEKNN